MQIRTLLLRNLAFYWKANAAVLAGVATAVAVLAGALVVGDSVKTSLRRLALERIGNADFAVQATSPFREALAGSFGHAVPMLVLEGLVIHQETGRRASGVAIYGVSNSFWSFHGKSSLGLTNRQAAASQALATELGAKEGDSLLLRLEKPSDIPAESLFGKKENASPASRWTVKTIAGRGQLGEFSLRPQQGSIKAMFVPLSRLQREVGMAGRANTILVSKPASPAEQILRSAFTLEDVGIRLKPFEDRGALQMDTASGVIPDALAETAKNAAAQSGLPTIPALTYMATSIRVGDRTIPYSLVAGLDLQAVGVKESTDQTLVLNDWAARELGARPGEPATMEFLAWHNDGRMTTEKAEFVVGAVVKMTGLAGDRDLTPEYPGITDASSISEWDPPFPMDLGKIKPRDEAYWDSYKTTPKAFLTLARAQQLWQSRWGKISAIRMPVESRDAEGLDRVTQNYRARLRKAIDPLASGFVVRPLREQSEAASEGSTDFGEYFGYFSFFLMVSALMLAGLFFRLGIEQRYVEIGLLRAVGFPPGRVRNLFLAEGVLLAVGGGLIGVVGAVGYAALVLLGLGTWWVDAVGTRDLALNVSATPLIAGLAGGVIAAALTIVLTLRGLRDVTPRQLLSGGDFAFTPKYRTKAPLMAIVCGVICAGLLGASIAGAIPAAGGFFGVGLLFLIGALAYLRGALARSIGQRIDGMGSLAFRNSGYRPGRTVLSAALIASATFLVVSVEAFRRDPNAGASDPKSGTGGYSLLAESVRPLYHNPNSSSGKQDLGLPALENVSFVPFRLRPGDDASCLNLYLPQNPKVLGVPADFAKLGRFGFAESEGESRNPWSLLDQKRSDGAIPAIADANSIQYVLHKKLGAEIVLTDAGGAPVKLRLVAALSDSVFQSEILIGEKDFLRLFPAQQGFRTFLIDAPAQKAGEMTSLLENALSDYGFDVTATSERLAGFHRVENAYLSTFQTLGGLGLLLGTVGLAAVLFRNVFERRRELALLSAVGYSRRAQARLVLRENLFLLAAGLTIGVVAAAIAIGPVLASRGFRFSIGGMGGLLLTVAAAGVLATWAATRIALRQPLLNSLRAG